MFILIFENEVQSTVELITAIPKLCGETHLYHRQRLRPIAEAFAAKRMVQRNTMLAEYDMVWKYWDSHGFAMSDDQDWFIRAVDTTRGHPGIGIGPRWDGIACRETPVTDWLDGTWPDYGGNYED